MILTDLTPMCRRYAFTLLLTALAITLLIGCGSCRTVKTTATVAEKATLLDTTIKTTTLDQQFRFRTIKDSAIGIAAKTISFVLPTDNVTDTLTSNHHLKLHVYRDYYGLQHIDCTADSLTIVIARLIQDSIYQSHANDSVYSSRQKDYYSETTATNITKTALIPQVVSWLAVALITIVVWGLLSRLYKRTKP